MPKSKADVVDLSAHEVLTRLGDEMKKWNGWEIKWKRWLHALHHLSREQIEGLSYGTHGVRPIPLHGVVNLNATPKIPTIPYETVTLFLHEKGAGKVTIEKNLKDELYVDGRRVVLYKACEDGEMVPARKLQRLLKGKTLLNACVFEFLMANPGFIPESWKNDGTKHLPSIHFFGTLFVSEFELDYAMFFQDGAWKQSLHSFKYLMYSHYYVAMLED